MKILYFLDGLNRGGVENIVVQLANYFYKSGNEVHIAYLYKDMADMQNDLHPDIILHPLPFVSNKKPYLQYFKHFNKLVALLEDLQPEIIHAHNSSFSYYFLSRAIIKAKIKSKNLRTLHSIMYFSGSESLINKARFYFDKTASKQLCTTIISVSQLIKNFVDEKYPKNRSVLITNGINTKKIIDSNATKEILKINPDTIVGIYVSRICAGKNHKLLLQSWRKVIESIPNALLILAGDGPLKAEYEKYCASLCIIENVLFTGSITNVEDFLRIADIGIFPSESEGLSLALCEMMAAGLPVIVSNIPAFHSLIQEGQTGIFYETYNAEDLSNKVISLIRDKIGREELGKNAKQCVLENFTIQSMLEKYQKSYNDNYSK